MPLPPTMTLNRTFIRNDVYASLRDWIVVGQLEPGETLRDKELAARLGVSRTPVREALRKLEDEDLVETAANRWTRVAPLTLEEVGRIYPIIQSLETLALNLSFSRLTLEHLLRMQNANDTLLAALDGSELYAAVHADAALHQVLIDAADNPELSRLLEHLKTKYKRLELAYFGDAGALLASYEEHRALVAALKEENLEAAVACLATNWQASVERLRASGG